MSNWRFGLLGPMTVECDGAVRKVPHGRQRAVLTALLLRPGEVTAAQSLLDDIWGPGADRSVLNVSVMRLRRSLGDRSVLEADGDGYRIAVAEDAVDVHRFRRLCRDAAETTERGRRRTLLHEALALWRGEAFGDVEPTGAHSELISILDEERLNALEQRIAADLDAGATTELVPELRELVEAQPFRERFWCQLVLALYRSGRQTAALDAFRQVRERLSTELGVEPGSELRGLQERILNEDATLLAPARSDSAATESANEYVRLVPAQLPRPVSNFTGRRRELKRLDDLLGSDTAPIALVTGPPGVGKTALAVEWAGRVTARYPGGQLHIDLGGHGRTTAARPLDALAHLLRSTGLPPDRIPTDTATAASLFRSMTADKRMLVLLDNAATEDQVRPLLPGRGCLVVVTSRNGLTGLVAREGAVEVETETLSDDDAIGLLGAVIGERRIAAEAAAGADLANACGNLPLALRIAAANVSSRKHGGIAAYVSDLRNDDRLNALSVTGDEQMAVRSAFRSSYTSLPAQARTMFCLLGLIPGREITTETAAVLMDEAPRVAARVIDQLRTAHLVHPYQDDRFVLHDLLRLFADELAADELPPEQRTAAIHRLYVHYAHAVERAAQLLYPQSARLSSTPEAPNGPLPFTEGPQAMGWLEAEQSNLVAAVTAAEANDEPLNGCRVGSALRGYLMMKMELVDWFTVSRAGLAAARATGDLGAEASARLGLANLHGYRFQSSAAVMHYQRTLTLSRHVGWADGEAAAHNNLAVALQHRGSLRQAADHLRDAYELNRRSGWVVGQAMNLCNLGGLQMEMGLHTEAIANFRRARQLHRRAGSRPGEAHSLSALGEVLTETGDYEDAKDLLEQAISMQEVLDDQTQLPCTYGYLANLHVRMRDHPRAAELASHALDLTGEEGHEATAIAVRVLADVDHADGRYDRALEGYQRAIRLAGATGGALHMQTRALIDIARLYRGLHRYGAARHHADRAATLSRRTGFGGLLKEAEAVRVQVLSACRSWSG